MIKISSSASLKQKQINMNWLESAFIAHNKIWVCILIKMCVE